MKARSVLVGALVAASGCTTSIEAPDPFHEAITKDTTEKDRELLLASHLSSGWIRTEESPVVPRCGAVLVASNVAVTTAQCVDGADAVDIVVGFGDTDDGRTYDVERIEEPTDAPLAALRLHTSVMGIAPADLGEIAGRACALDSVSYERTYEDRVGDRWTWSGCLEPAGDSHALRVMDDAPNCHGDAGAGVFQASGLLVGVVIGVASTEDDCASAVLVKTVGKASAFFDAAMAMAG